MRDNNSTFGLGWELLMAWFEKGNQGFLQTWEAYRKQTRGQAPTYDNFVGWYALSISMILSGLILWASQVPALLDHYSRNHDSTQILMKSGHTLPPIPPRSAVDPFMLSNSAWDSPASSIDAFTDQQWQTLMNRHAEPLNQARLSNEIFNKEFLSGYSGTVRVRIAVDALGQYKTHYILHASNTRLRKAVEQHVNQLVFRPAICAGRTSASWTIVEFRF